MNTQPRAALFTRLAAGKTALGDLNAELSMPPVNPRRERMDDPEFDTGDARVQEPLKVQAGYRDTVKIEITCTADAADSIMPLLEDLKVLGSIGASRSIIIEDFTDDGSKDREKLGDGKHFFDGDGAGQISDIKRTTIKKDDPKPKADKAPKEGDPENHRDYGCNAMDAVMEEHPEIDGDAFWQYVADHNRADCDTGELGDVNEDEIHRLFDAFTAKKKAKLFTRKADVKMHTTPPVGAPRIEQRTHLDEDLKDELNPTTDDPDLIRHTTGVTSGQTLGRLFP